MAQNESGATLFEVLAVVAVGFIALLAVVQLSGGVQTQNASASTERLLTTLVDEVKAYKKINQTYAQMGNCKLYESSSDACYLVQQGLVTRYQKTPLGGDIAVSPTPNFQNVRIVFENIPSAACQKILLDSNNKEGLDKIEVFASNQRIIDLTNEPTTLATATCHNIPILNPNSGSGRTSFNMIDFFIRPAYAAGPVPVASGCTIPATGSGGSPISYNLVTIESFPVSSTDVGLICNSKPSHTIAWTFN